MSQSLDLEKLDWEKTNGLIPAIVQDAATGSVLMLAYMNRQALEKTLEKGRVTFWSRSREELWTKGETSGNFLDLVRIESDCDGDTLLVEAHPTGPACHTGNLTCFDDEPFAGGANFLLYLEELIRSRAEERPTGSYTTRLFEKGLPEIARKVGEEAIELIVSPQEGRDRTVEETADLFYHLLVFLREREIDLSEILETLRRRHASD